MREYKDSAVPFAGAALFQIIGETFCLTVRLISERARKNLSESSKSIDNGASSYRRFLDGDDKGLEEIVRDYKDGLILYLNSYVSNISIAEELMRIFLKSNRQEALLILNIKIDRAVSLYCTVDLVFSI